jgi:serine-type D-Ala-D-Ala carboxypeptidase (penicillin-binding protein 5/6)
MRLIPVLLLLALGSTLHAQAAPLPVPPPPAIAAKAYLLLDFNSGARLAERNPQMRVEPASLTKLMTAYLTFTALKEGRIRFRQQVPVSVKAWRTIGSRMFIEPRKPVTVKELINGMIVQSGNDASIALAEAIAGSEEVFVQLMNRDAQRLGLKNTHFMNATGLPHPDHYSTTEDLALLAAAIIRDFPKYYGLYSQKEFSYNKIKQANRNQLLWSDPTVDGMKTGHTEEAGYCLIASAKRGEHRLISVVLGAKSEAGRAAESQKLLNYGFQFYDSFRVQEKNQPVATLQVFKGTADTVKAGFLSDLYVTLPKGQRSRLKATVETLQPLVAPIRAGQRVGTMKVMLDGKPYRELPVVSLEDVPLAGILGRGWDSIRLLFR